MSFFIGLFIGMGLSQNKKRSHIGGVQFMTVDEVMEHLENPTPDPFEKQDVHEQKEIKNAKTEITL
jgi:hypothetical protein